jgi:exosome complex component RRP4
VAEIGPSNWMLDINAPYPASLHVSEVPWRVEFGETAKYLQVNDIILAKIISVDEVKHVSASLNGAGLRKLPGGHLIFVSHAKVPRLIGKGGSMISLIKTYTRCRIFVGQNGALWLDGDVDDITLATRAIQKIEREAHLMGLTDSMKAYLAEETKGRPVPVPRPERQGESKEGGSNAPGDEAQKETAEGVDGESDEFDGEADPEDSQ